MTKVNTKPIWRSYNTQEFISVFVAIPPLIYFLTTCFTFISETPRLFFGILGLAIIVTQLPSFLMVKLFIAKIRKLESTDFKHSKDTATTRHTLVKDALNFPLQLALVTYLRTAIGSLAVFVPFIFMGTLSGKQLLVILFLAQLMALGTSIISYLRIELTISDLSKWLPGSHNIIQTTGSAALGLSTKTKFAIISVVIITVGNIFGAFMAASINGIAVSEIKIGFFLVVLQGLILAYIIGSSLAARIATSVKKSAMMIQELGNGHISAMRINFLGNDELGLLSSTMDQFADDLDKYVVGSMKKIADGDVSMDIPAKDEKDEIAPALNGTIQAVRGLTNELNTLTQSATNGDLSVRGNIQKFQGEYKSILEGVNNTLDAVSRPVNEVMEVMSHAAQKDLHKLVEGDYKGRFADFKENVNLALNSLNEALSQVQTSAEQVTSASTQISSGSQTLAQGAQEQSSSLQEVSSSMEEMASMTKQNAESAKQAKSLSADTQKSAEEGNQAIAKMSIAIDKIAVSAEETGKIIKSIDEIAFQTNLLALNAAVEAARAGEAGRGFAVVAEEVRNLASRSAEAAKSTALMIQDSVKNAGEGVAVHKEVGQSLSEIYQGSNKVTALTTEIAIACDEQNKGIEMMTGAISQINQITQENAANSEESASASEELSSQAQELSAMVGIFRLR